VNAPDENEAARAIERFLRAVGAPVDTDPELAGTPARVADTFIHDVLRGYTMDPAEILRDTTASQTQGLVVVTDIAAVTMCPHHLMIASGRVHVGYVPTDRLVGLGALARLVDCFSRRFALQEVLAQNVAHALVTHLAAKAAGCVVDLIPTCLTARGDRRHDAHAITSAWSGEMVTNHALRTELLQTIATKR